MSSISIPDDPLPHHPSNHASPSGWDFGSAEESHTAVEDKSGTMKVQEPCEAQKSERAHDADEWVFGLGSPRRRSEVNEMRQSLSSFDNLLGLEEIPEEQADAPLEVDRLAQGEAGPVNPEIETQIDADTEERKHLRMSRNSLDDEKGLGGCNDDEEEKATKQELASRVACLEGSLQLERENMKAALERIDELQRVDRVSKVEEEEWRKLKEDEVRELKEVLRSSLEEIDALKAHKEESKECKPSTIAGSTSVEDDRLEPSKTNPETLCSESFETQKALEQLGAEKERLEELNQEMEKLRGMDQARAQEMEGKLASLVRAHEEEKLQWSAALEEASSASAVRHNKIQELQEKLQAEQGSREALELQLTHSSKEMKELEQENSLRIAEIEKKLDESLQAQDEASRRLVEKEEMLREEERLREALSESLRKVEADMVTQSPRVEKSDGDFEIETVDFWRSQVITLEEQLRDSSLMLDKFTSSSNEDALKSLLEEQDALKEALKTEREAKERAEAFLKLDSDSDHLTQLSQERDQLLSLLQKERKKLVLLEKTNRCKAELTAALKTLELAKEEEGEKGASNTRVDLEAFEVNRKRLLHVLEEHDSSPSSSRNDAKKLKEAASKITDLEEELEKKNDEVLASIEWISEISSKQEQSTMVKRAGWKMMELGARIEEVVSVLLQNARKGSDKCLSSGHSKVLSKDSLSHLNSDREMQQQGDLLGNTAKTSPPMIEKDVNEGLFPEEIFRTESINGKMESEANRELDGWGFQDFDALEGRHFGAEEKTKGPNNKKPSDFSGSGSGSMKPPLPLEKIKDNVFSLGEEGVGDALKDEGGVLYLTELASALVKGRDELQQAFEKVTAVETLQEQLENEKSLKASLSESLKRLERDHQFLTMQLKKERAEKKGREEPETNEEKEDGEGESWLLKEMSSELADKSSKIESLSAELQRLKLKLKRTQEEKKSIVAENFEKVEKNSEKNETILSFLEDMEQENESLKNWVEELKETTENTIENFERVEIENLNHSARIEELSLSPSKERVDIPDDSRKLQILEQKNQELMSAVDSFKAELARLEAEKGDLERSLEDWEMRREREAEDMQTLVEEKVELKRQAEETLKELEEAKQKKVEAEERELRMGEDLQTSRALAQTTEEERIEKDQLRELISEHENEIRSLRQEASRVEALQKELEDGRAALRSAEEGHAEKEEAVRYLHSRIAELESFVEQVEGKGGRGGGELEALQEELNHTVHLKDQEIQKLQGKIQSLEHFEKLAEQLAAEKTDLEWNLQEVSESTAALVESRVEEVRHEMEEELTSLVEAKEEAVKKAKFEASGSSAKYEEVQRQLQELTLELEERQRELVGKEGQVSALREEVAKKFDAQLKVEELQEELQRKEEVETALRQDLEESRVIMRKINEEKTEKQEAVEYLQTRVAELEVFVEKAGDDGGARLEEVEELTKELTKAVQMKDEHIMELTEKVISLEECEHALNRVEAERKALERRMKEVSESSSTAVEARVEEVRKEMEEELASLVKDKEAALKKTKTELSSLTSKYEQEKKQRAELEAQVNETSARVGKEGSETKKKIEDFQKAVQDLRAANAHLREELDLAETERLKVQEKKEEALAETDLLRMEIARLQDEAQAVPLASPSLPPPPLAPYVDLTKLQDAERQKREIEETVQQLRFENEHLKNSAQAVQSEKNREIQRLSAQLREVELIESDRTENAKKISVLEGELQLKDEKFLKEVSQWRARNEAKDVKIRDLACQITSLKSRSVEPFEVDLEGGGGGPAPSSVSLRTPPSSFSTSILNDMDRGARVVVSALSSSSRGRLLAIGYLMVLHVWSFFVLHWSLQSDKGGLLHPHSHM